MKATWFQVKFEIALVSGQPPTQLGARLCDEIEREKFIKRLPELGATFVGYDVMYADDCDATIEKLKTDFNIVPNKVVALKIV